MENLAWPELLPVRYPGTVEKVTASQALFIKLGSKGAWEKECIDSGTIRVDYRDVPDELCQSGQWNNVRQVYLGTGAHGEEATATRYSNELRRFYTAGHETIWITFYSGNLWWAFAEGPVTVDSENYMYRRTAKGWCSTDINGRPLDCTKISGRLTRVIGYRGTICEVAELKFLLARLNGEVLPEVQRANVAREELLASIVPLIQNLTWRDFELLVDLVFSSAGWRRLGVLGKTEKDIDLDMVQPVTQERVMIQVKGEASMEVAKGVAKSAESLTQYDRVFLVTHSFRGTCKTEELGRLKILDATTLAPLVLDAGLTDWLLEKSS